MDTPDDTVTRPPDPKLLAVLDVLKKAGEGNTDESMRYAKEAFAHLLANGEEDVAEAIFMALDEVQDDLAEIQGQSKDRLLPGDAAQHNAVAGTPQFRVGEPIVIHGHWCKIRRFLPPRSMEVVVGKPTAALLKSVKKNLARQAKQTGKRNSRGDPRGTVHKKRKKR